MKHTKAVVFVACLVPLAWLFWLANTPGVGGSGLGANPQEFLNRYLGQWALKFLIMAIAITPARKLFGWSGLTRYRRMIGLYAFFYVVLHVTSYVVIDQTFNWPEIWQDILKRNFITVGMVCLLALIPLAITSNNAMIRRLGGRAWRNLHKLIYAIVPLACLHFFMMRKGIQMEPLVYGAIIAALLMVRLIPRRKQQGSNPSGRPRSL